MSDKPVEETEIPEIIDLPVYREDYISQEQVDKACRLLWKEEPYSVQALIDEEVVTHRNNPTQWLGMSRMLGRLGYFFREKEESGELNKLSYTSVVDLIYETERRVRIAIGLDDFKPIGQPIAPTPHGPFPENIGRYFESLDNDKPNYSESKDKTKRKMPPERTIIYHKLAKEYPEVLFAYTEAIRRYQAGGESDRLIAKYFKEHLS